MPPCSLQTFVNGALMSNMMFPSAQRRPGALYFGKLCPDEPQHPNPDQGKFLSTRAAQLRLVCRIQYTSSIDLLSAFHVQDSPNPKVAPDDTQVN
jgi:hypothetical protein